MLTRLGPEKVILNNAGKTTRKNIKHFTIESFCHGRGLWMLRFLMLLSCGSLGAMTWPRAKAWEHLEVSQNGKNPQIIHLYIGIFHCKPSILGYPLLGNLVWVMWKTPGFTLKPDEREYHCEHPKFPTQTIRELFPEYDA